MLDAAEVRALFRWSMRLAHSGPAQRLYKAPLSRSHFLTNTFVFVEPPLLSHHCSPPAIMSRFAFTSMSVLARSGPLSGKPSGAVAGVVTRALCRARERTQVMPSAAKSALVKDALAKSEERRKAALIASVRKPAVVAVPVVGASKADSPL